MRFLFSRFANFWAVACLCIAAQEAGAQPHLGGDRFGAGAAIVGGAAGQPLGSAAPSVPVLRSVPPAAFGGSESAGELRRPLNRSDPTGGSGAASMEPAPAQPNEFQRYVFTATGRALTVFGERYFASPTAGFEPADRLPVPANYVVGPGDELHVRGWGSVDIDVRVTVDRQGQIYLPRVGVVTVSGLQAGDLASQLRARFSRVFKGFQLDVTLGPLRSVQVFVVGHARQPGTYTVSGLSTMINAIFASGGPGPDGSMRKVQLRRGSAVVAELDLYRFITEGHREADQRLQNGDVIVYGPVGPRVAVVGAVDAPAVFELEPGGTRLASVLQWAGGLRAHADAQSIHLDRIDRTQPSTPRRAARVDLALAASTVLEDGDIIHVQPVGAAFGNAVTLRGNVAQPLRYPHVQGMRISDLIPDRDALITRDYHQRKNRLVQYLPAPPERATERAAPTTATAERPAENPFTPDPDRQTARLLAEREPRPLDVARRDRTDASDTVRNLLDEPNWEYATIERLDKERVATRLIPFNLGRAVLNRDPEHDLLLQPGDIVTVFGSRDLRGPQERSTRLVRLEGEVQRPGVYQLEPGETLRGLLRRAGGATPQAYLFGTEFTRESTRQRQAEALQAALRRLEASLAGSGSRQLANLGNADAAAAARLQAAEEESRRAQLASLRAIRPNGRIALELSPQIRQVEELPDLPLEDGDAVVLPPRPGFVFAVGAVSNENALLWRAGRKTGDYLNLAGLSPEADKDNIFVVRADGSVVHAKQSRGFFSASALTSLDLVPGDTIVVPGLTDRETAWNAFIRGAKDWSQILSNFGIAAAAIKSLSN